MKVAVIGAGNVGKTVFYDLQHIGMVTDIVLVGRSLDKIQAEVMDAQDAAVVREEYGPKLSYGGYEAVEGADVIVNAAGSSKLSSDRMEMLQANCPIADDIFSEVIKYNRDAIVINATNPLDVVTMQIQKTTGFDPRRVIGSGTLLESARLERYIADILEISEKSIIISVVGEHGASATALLSSVRINGLTLDEYLRTVTGERAAFNVERLNEAFKKEPFKIFYGKGYTSTGVSATVCKIISAIAADSREIFPVSSVLQGEYGVNGIAVSVPSIIGRNGIEDIHEVYMSEDEHKAFMNSVEVIREAASAVDLI